MRGVCAYFAGVLLFVALIPPDSSADRLESGVTTAMCIGISLFLSLLALAPKE